MQVTGVISGISCDFSFSIFLLERSDYVVVRQIHFLPRTGGTLLGLGFLPAVRWLDIKLVPVNVTTRLVVRADIRFRQTIHVARRILCHNRILLTRLHAKLIGRELSIRHRMGANHAAAVHHIHLVSFERLAVLAVQHDYGLSVHLRCLGIRVVNGILVRS